MRDSLPTDPRLPPLPQLIDRLAAAPGARIPGWRFMRQAAVAVVVAERGGVPSLLLIERARRQGDPWSGHIAFPGGRVETSDRDAEAAAVRETREEIGLDLRTRARPVGALSQLLAMAHGRPLPMVVAPYVYLLGAGDVVDDELALNHEVASLLWVPLRFFADSTQRAEMTWRVGQTALPMPCCRWDGHVVWGLTLAMIDEVVARVLGLPYRGRRARLLRMVRVLWARRHGRGARVERPDPLPTGSQDDA